MARLVTQPFTSPKISTLSSDTMSPVKIVLRDTEVVRSDSIMGFASVFVVSSFALESFSSTAGVGSGDIPRGPAIAGAEFNATGGIG